MDADDPENRTLRDSLFALSGYSHYPQLFVHMGGETSYWGDWDDLMAESVGNETDLFELTDESDVESDVNRQVQIEFACEKVTTPQEETSCEDSSPHKYQEEEKGDARSDEENSVESEDESDASSASYSVSEATPIESHAPSTPEKSSTTVQPLTLPPSKLTRTQNTSPIHSTERTSSAPVKTTPSSFLTSRNVFSQNTSPVVARNSSPSERLGHHDLTTCGNQSPKIMSSSKLETRDAMVAKTVAAFENGNKSKKGNVGGGKEQSKPFASKTKLSTTTVKKKSVSTVPEKIQVANPVMNCYEWYSRLGSPSRAVFEKRVATLPASCGVYPEHVDLLPWNSSNTSLEFRAVRNLMLGKSIQQ
jgi:hypothetical protein